METFNKQPTLRDIELALIEEQYAYGEISLVEAIKAADGKFDTTQDLYDWIAKIQAAEKPDNPFIET